MAFEDQWLAAFSSLLVWTPPDNPILVVAPHPDDETLGAGGFIAYQRSRGVPVTVAAVTDGEKAYQENSGLGAVREVEQANALARLGVSSDRITRFRIPDGEVASREAELVDRLTPLISPDMHVVAPWQGDIHPDHQACGRAVEAIARRRGAALTSYFFWTWHYGTPALVSNLPLYRFPLPPEILHAKSEALSCHRSQLVREHGEPVLGEQALAPAYRPFETFALEIENQTKVLNSITSPSCTT